MEKAEVYEQYITAVMAEIQSLAKRFLLSDLEILSLQSNIVGRIIAVQDDKSVTPGEAMSLVYQNLFLGNRDAVDGVRLDVEEDD